MMMKWTCLKDKNAMYAFKRGGESYSRGRDMWKKQRPFGGKQSAFGGLENFYKKRNGDDFMFGKRHDSPLIFRMAGMGQPLKRSERPVLPFPLLSKNDAFYKRGVNFGDHFHNVGLFKRSQWYHEQQGRDQSRRMSDNGWFLTYLLAVAASLSSLLLIY